MSVSALACAIAKGKNENEINLLSAFFNQLGESLETIAAVQQCNNNNSANNINENNNSGNQTQNIVF